MCVYRSCSRPAAGNCASADGADLVSSIGPTERISGRGAQMATLGEREGWWG